MAYPFLVIALLMVFVISALAGLFAGLPELIGFTSAALEWCESIFILCLPYTAVIKAAGFWSGAALISAGLVYSAARGAFFWRRGLKALERLPVSDRGLSVVLIRDDSLKTAFTHGLLRPRIYISTGLLKGLTRDEVRSVLAHETHHRAKRDPLRFFCLSLLKDLLFYLPIGKWIAGLVRGLKEMEADSYAASRTGTLVLAGALVKTARFATLARALSPQAVSISGAGSVNERVRGILYGVKPARKYPPLKVVLSSVIVGSFLVLALALPMTTTGAMPEDCTMEHCSHHADKVAGCRPHCETGHIAHRGL